MSLLPQMGTYFLKVIGGQENEPFDIITRVWLRPFQARPSRVHLGLLHPRGQPWKSVLRQTYQKVDRAGVPSQSLGGEEVPLTHWGFAIVLKPLTCRVCLLLQPSEQSPTDAALQDT